MRRALALVLALAGCAAPPVAAPTPTPPGTPAPTPTQASAPSPTMTPAMTVGAPIDLYRMPLTAASGLAGPSVDAFGRAFLTLESGDLEGEWVSEWRQPGFAFTRLVPSWNANAPQGTWISVETQVRRVSGGESAWYSFGRWTLGDGNPALIRASVDGQRDADARIETDTLLASVPLSAYRLRVTFGAHPGVPAAPQLYGVVAVVSDDAAVRAAPPSAHAGVKGEITVPQYSQEIHAGRYPEYAGGGEAWCSPTSTTMVLERWGRRPDGYSAAWVDPRFEDRTVIHAARYTYDAEYGGTGNWSFNVAYASTLNVNAFVTQLRSLAEAERFIAAGIPLVASVKIAPGALPGFLLPQGSEGHLLVIRGFTETGDVISNDPAANSNAEVRRVYPRAAFERAWMGGSGGIVYVIHPPDIGLPPRVDGATANW